MRFQPGITNFLNSTQFSQDTRVGVVTNNTGRDINGVHLIDLLLKRKNFCKLVKIFTPEHGFSSNEPDGQPVNDSIYAESIPIISLYGKNKIPQAKDLENIDMLVYDIQDVGVRFYTYISTLRNILDVATKHNISVHILDRPDLSGGKFCEGPMLDSNLSSFVGHIPIPVRYGMTPGELALWWKNKANLNLELKVWKCSNYKILTPFNKLGIPWFKPSPSIKSEETIKFYPGTCLFEGTNLSEGRGTNAPFQIIGAPWVNADLWLELFKTVSPSEIDFKKVHFTPTFSKYTGENCNGIKLSTSVNFIKQPFKLAINLLWSLIKTHPQEVIFTKRPNLDFPFFDYLAGNSSIRKELQNGKEYNEINIALLNPSAQFLESRKQCLLYKRETISSTRIDKEQKL